MGYTDTEKLEKSKQVFIKYITEIQTYAEFKDFLNNKPKGVIKPKLKQAFKDSKDEHFSSIILHEEKRVNDEAMDSEIDTL